MKDVREVLAEWLSGRTQQQKRRKADSLIRHLSAANLEIGPGWNTDMSAGKQYVNETGKPVLGYWPDCHSDDQFKMSVPCDDPFIQWTDVADTIDPDLDGQPTAWKPILPPEGGE